jgi:hypothetical protein
MFSKSIRDFFKNPIITVPTVVFAMLTQIPIYFLTASLPPDESMLTNELSDPTAALQFFGKFMLIGFLIFVLYLFLSPIIVSWTSVMSRDVVNEIKPNLGSGLKESFRYYWRVLGTLVLSFLILMGAYIVFAILIAIPLVPLAMSQSESSGIWAIVAVIILAFIFVLVMIFLAICLMPIQPLLVYDNLGVTESIGRGFKFGMKKFFPILGVLLLNVVISMILAIAAEFISPVVVYIVTAITSYLGVFIIVFVLNLYKNYKSKTELNVPHYHAETVTNEFNPGMYNNQTEDTDNNNENLAELPEENKNKDDEDDNNRTKFTI